jgi:group I intron endonuclease
MQTDNLKLGGVYSIFNLITGKQYIGSCTVFSRRKIHHFCRLRAGQHKNPYLQHSFNKHGEGNFEFRILEYVKDIGQLASREQFYIDKFQACNPENGYNLSPKAYTSAGVKRSPECRELHKQITTELWKDAEYKEKVLKILQSDSHRAKVSATNKKIFNSQKQKKNRSDRAKKLWNDPIYRAKQTKTRSTPEYKAERERVQAKFNSEQSTRIKLLWQDPQYRKNCIEGRAKNRKKHETSLPQNLGPSNQTTSSSD